jgi:beta-phosphoglucomutase-like phosphatase (HAD superfamily)
MDVTKFKAAIFDLDGTLIQSRDVWSEIDRLFFEKRGLKVPDDYYDAVSTKNFREAAEYTKALLGLDQDVESIMQEWHEMAVYEYSHVIGEVDGAADYLRYLHDSGVKLGLATILNVGALIDHDVEIGEGSHILMGAVVRNMVKLPALSRVESNQVVE